MVTDTFIKIHVQSDELKAFIAIPNRYRSLYTLISNAVGYLYVLEYFMRTMVLGILRKFCYGPA